MNETKRIQRAGFLFLTFGLLTEMLVAYTTQRGMLVLQQYACPVFFAFAGMALCAGSYRRQKDLLAGAAFALWYVLSRILLRELYLEGYSYIVFCDLCSALLLCFPCAAAMDDGGRKKGLALAAVIFLAGYGLLAWLSIAGAVLGENIILPGLGTELGVVPQSKRLYANWNPNTSACMFLIALMLGLWLAVRGCGGWKPLVLLMGVGLYVGIALSGSRTVMLQTGCLVAGIALLGCMRLKIKCWKRWAVGLLAAVLCLVLVVGSFVAVANGVSNLSQNIRASAETEEAETKNGKQAAPGVRVRDLTERLANLNGRFKVFASAAKIISDDPSVLIKGMRETALEQRLMKRHSFSHTHNAYLQTLLTMGIPGLAIAIWLTVRALWVSIRVMFHRRAAFSDQLLALIPPVLLLATMSEPYLFKEVLTACNMIFFLVFGYLLETERALRS